MNLNERTARELGWEQRPYGQGIFYWYHTDFADREPEEILLNFRTDSHASLQLEMHMADKNDFAMLLGDVVGKREWQALIILSDEDAIIRCDESRTEAVWQCWLAFMGWSEDDDT